jgi:hypothetical protein
MLREIIGRFAYRYRLFRDESQGDKLGAGTPPPEISPKDEPKWRMTFRLLGILTFGLMVLSGLGRVAADAFPTAGRGIGIAVISLAIIWSAVGLFMVGGELLMKLSDSDGDDESI